VTIVHASPLQLTVPAPPVGPPLLELELVLEPELLLEDALLLPELLAEKLVPPWPAPPEVPPLPEDDELDVVIAPPDPPVPLDVSPVAGGSYVHAPTATTIKPKNTRKSTDAYGDCMRCLPSKSDCIRFRRK
jgi:hypothetical protein